MALTPAPPIGRIPILDVTPSIPGTGWIPKAFVGEVVPFTATVFREGHGRIGAEILLTDPTGTTSVHRMTPVADRTDTWAVPVMVTRSGLWGWQVAGFSDDFSTWMHAAGLKIAADVDVEVMLRVGAELLTEAAGERTRPGPSRQLLREAASAVADDTVVTAERLRSATAPDVRHELSVRPLRRLRSTSADYRLLVERERAGVGAWYEFFPRSEGATRSPDGTWRSGTFATATARLPGVAGMGFDVLYVPPIHPIGVSGRKGPNNSLTPAETDPGSPWAIGSAAGGHDAVHPDLGTMADFRRFVAAAAAVGIEVAIDLAVQASPDHPWVTEHPEWFTRLPDGSIEYAENPPKKYEDIYPINFDNDPDGIRAEVLRIVRVWIEQGVRIFRVDNPHTKPLQLWEWLIRAVNAEHPEVIFLAEAFTRPAIMAALAKVGFQQSYTYFTWRNTKSELEEFFTGLATESADYLRPNLFVNTPDILPEYLQHGGRAAFTVRATLAATAAPTWGVYSGFELYESVARPGSEEYIDNEKYEYSPRDFGAAEAAGDSLAPFLTLLNRVRKEHPTLRQLRNLRIQWSDDDAVLVYSKHLAAEFTGTQESDVVIVVVNLDPATVRETMVHLDLASLGMTGRDGAPPVRFLVEELVTGMQWEWGADNYVRLDPGVCPVHILHVVPSPS